MTTSDDPTRSTAISELDTDTPDPPATTAVHRQIVDEHVALKEVLSRIDRATDLHALLTLLAELRGLLVRHFATEEADEGFERLVGRRAPHLLGNLEEVLDEHEVILGDLDRLAAAARVCLDGPVAVVRAQAAGLVALLHAHEEKETELLVGAVYDDLGTPS